ncbi:protein-glutamate O-methyltransferase CheR [Massilia sp. CF038]|uniref:CheR family methyltransferase n=1 Tax=Massilia sp. CF038 TaxID=1881045 RepID=UPI00091C4CA4|nr:CheR family methyltransferase [Massilia sp. CF038]SHG67589.1 chemotaxis protein methyltransferase CheR [Massilia sp. CF038]
MQHTDTVRATEELETELLLEALFQRFGFDFRAYERSTLKRKLQAVMQQRQLATVSQLQDRMLHDPQAQAALLRALSVQPAALFDDPQQARQLRAVLASSLRASAVPKVWLAECAGAEEAWSLAILLADEQLHARTEIFATVANEDVLADVAGASIALERLDEYQENYLKSGGRANLADYFETHGKRAVLQPGLRSRITWAQYNMVTDASFNEFQLILCRHALADFGPVLRQQTLKLFHDSLALFGVLGLDREMDDGDVLRGSYQQIAAHHSWYKRIS